MTLGTNLRRILLVVGLLVIASSHRLPVLAHANLERSDPAANAFLTEPPAEIRLWFTEPLEPAFSEFSLIDANGDAVATPGSVVDNANPSELVMQPGALPDGLYTVAWRAVSATDGHATQGSFSFGINFAVANTSTVSGLDESARPDGVIIRALNLLALSLLIGSVGFWLFVWQPTSASYDDRASRWQGHLMLLGWLALGPALLLLLLLQVSTSGNISLSDALSSERFLQVISHTSFGSLWLVRFGLWVLIGLLLVVARRRPKLLWWIVAAGGLLLLAQSLFSHASAAQDGWASVAADWLHLLATALWIGGLAAFITVLIAFHRDNDRPAPFVSSLTARFSNYARVAFFVLIITGLYAAWLHVGSLDALTSTQYGRALTAKILLLIPVGVIAAINLTWTQRRLSAGSVAWIGRLRGLIGAEIALICAMLIAAAVLTSGSPARGIQSLRDAQATASQIAPYFQMGIGGTTMVHLEITPSYVGENEFIVSPYDENGAPIEDASLIRLRFDNLDRPIGTSELRPTSASDGTYRVSGANLSLPGTWRIRTTIQRPGQFDTVVDFTANIAPAPEPAQPDFTIPGNFRLAALSLTGIALIGSGGFFFAQGREFKRGTWLLSGAAIVVGLAFLLNAALVFVGSSAS